MIDDRPDDDLRHEEAAAPAAARPKRGFWLVAGTMAVSSVLVLIAILANRGTKDVIAHAQHSLRTAQAAAEAVRAQTGGFQQADAQGLAGSLPDLALVGPDTPSDGLDEVSVWADERAWAAAVRARPGACFFLRLDPEGEATYGSGTECTGAEAVLTALDDDW